MRIQAPIAFILLMSGCQPVVAQHLKPGSRVRVWSSEHGYLGVETWAMRQRGDTLFFRNAPSQAEYGIPRAALSQLDIEAHGGPRAGRAITGALFGLLGGVAIGFAAGSTKTLGRNSDGLGGPVGAGFGAILGPIAGGIIGFNTAHHWQAVADPRLVQLGPP